MLPVDFTFSVVGAAVSVTAASVTVVAPDTLLVTDEPSFSMFKRQSSCGISHDHRGSTGSVGQVQRLESGRRSGRANGRSRCVAINRDGLDRVSSRVVRTTAPFATPSLPATAGTAAVPPVTPEAVALATEPAPFLATVVVIAPGAAAALLNTTLACVALTLSTAPEVQPSVTPPAPSV